jgi:hypothetical protein
MVKKHLDLLSFYRETFQYLVRPEKKREDLSKMCGSFSLHLSSITE